MGQIRRSSVASSHKTFSLIHREAQFQWDICIAEGMGRMAKIGDSQNYTLLIFILKRSEPKGPIKGTVNYKCRKSFGKKIGHILLQIISSMGVQNTYKRRFVRKVLNDVILS